MPPPAWQAGLGAGRARLQGRGWFESRDSGSRRGQTGWRGRDQTGNGLTGCGRPKVPAYIEIPERQIYKWPWPAHGNGQSHGMGNGKLDGEAGQGTESGVTSSVLDPIPRQGTDGGHCINIRACTKGRYLRGCRKKVACPRRWWLLVGTSGRQRLKLGTHALTSASQCIDRAHGA